MGMCFDDLACKDVINVCTGVRLGRIIDLEINVCDGKILCVIVPGPCRCFGLLPSREECVIPWGKIVKIGEDVILVEC